VPFVQSSRLFGWSFGSRLVSDVGELGKNLSPSNLGRFWDYYEFGDISEKKPSSAFCPDISEEHGLNFREL
jgi:hypothetical protein